MATRGTLTVSSSTIDLGTVRRETSSLQCGLWDKSLPLTASHLNVQTAAFGKRRTLTLRGVKTGTQTQIEAFLLGIDDWVNTNGTTVQGLYYPLFHHDNTTSGSQSAYFSVLPDSFEYDVTEENSVAVLEYTLVVVEGLRVI